jgi:hypothetical protein
MERRDKSEGIGCVEEGEDRERGEGEDRATRLREEGGRKQSVGLCLPLKSS